MYGGIYSNAVFFFLLPGVLLTFEKGGPAERDLSWSFRLESRRDDKEYSCAVMHPIPLEKNVTYDVKTRLHHRSINKQP